MYKPLLENFGIKPSNHNFIRACLSFFPKTKKPIISIFIGILFAITSSACSSDEEELFSKADVDATVEARLHQEQPPTATAIPTHTASPAPTVTSTPIPTATPTVEPTATLVPPSATRVPPTSTPTTEPTATPNPDPTITPTATRVPPTATPTVEPTATAVMGSTLPNKSSKQKVLNPAEIFSQVSNSVVHISTKIGAGSGIILPSSYVVTNAHVIWPYPKVRIVTPSGQEFVDVPVVKTDMLLDLALLGPIDISIDEDSTASLENGENLPIGSAVYLLGYPGAATQKYPKPSITRGIISNVMEFEPTETSFIQTDAAIAMGQSGGALVSEYGDIIGITGFYFTEALLGVAISINDIEKFITPPEGAEVEANDQFLATFTLKEPEGTSLTLPSEYYFGDQQTLYLDAELNQNINISAESDQPFFMSGYDATGIPFYLSGFDIYSLSPTDVSSDQLLSQKIEHVSQVQGPHFISFDRDYGLYFPELLPNEDYLQRLPIKVSSNVLLRTIQESEEPDQSLSTDSHSVYQFDYPYDIDTFEILLSAGVQITITVRSVGSDPFLTVWLPSGENIFDDDSGGGLFGTDAQLTFTAKTNDYYYIDIENNFSDWATAYTLTVTVKK